MSQIGDSKALPITYMFWYVYKICASRKMKTIKDTKSSPFFKNNKVLSWSHVLMKNGQSVAIPFKAPVLPTDIREKRSSETLSVSRDVFKVRNNLHAGMLRKPLERYHPNAHRSRLPSPTVVMPYKNSSSIVIGDRTSEDRRMYISSNKNNFSKTSNLNTSNGGIISTKTKWRKHLQDL